MSDDGFGPGIILGGILGLVIANVFMMDNVRGTTVKAYGALVEAKVPIVVTDYGNFYMWSESTKTSYQISSDTVKQMAANLKKDK